MRLILLGFVLFVFTIPTVLGATVNIDGSTEHQTIEGLGGNMESHSVYENNTYFWNLLFNDIGVSAIFSYAYLGHETWDAEEEFPVLIQAKNHGVQHFLAAMGSPPQSWKSNGHLLPEYYDDYGYYILNYTDYIKNNTGVDFTHVCPNNEPGIGTPGEIFHFQINISEYPTFLKTIGPILRNGLGSNVQIVAPDDWNIEYSIQYANLLMADSEARQYVDQLSTHTYRWPSRSNPQFWQTFANIAQTYNIPVAHTETWLSGTNNPLPHPAGLLTAKWIHHAFVDGQAVQFNWWDMMDRGPYSVDNPGLIQSKDWPPGGSPADGITKWGHAFKQFAHWVRPGAIRVDATSDDTNVLVSSYKHPTQNTFTIVAINDATSSRVVDFNINNLGTISALDAYRTSLTENSSYLGQISVTGNSFNYNLPAESTTTFTGIPGQPPQTCSSLGGTCCQTGETCSGTSQSASDCTICCLTGSCTTTQGLMASYNLDEGSGSTVGDSSGNGNTCSLVEGAWSPNGFINGAIYFDGSDDHVDCGNVLDMTTNEFSVSFWMKKGKPADNYESILYKSIYSAGGPGYGFLLRETGGNLKFTIGDGNTVIEARGPAVSDTNWHHVVGVRGNNEIRLYLDGSLSAQTADTVGSVSNIESFVIGKGGYGNNPGGPAPKLNFRGYLDEILIYDNVLTDQEISNLYSNGLNSHKEPPSITLNSPSDGATGISSPAQLSATPTDLDGDSTDLVFFGSAMPANAEDFTIIALPDTQYYAESYPNIFDSQIQWIVNNVNALNIVFVTHEGDIVENWDAINEWDDANASMSMLDGVVPWGVLPGNHDQQYPSSYPHNAQYYNQYFSYTRFEHYSWYGGHYGADNDNNYQLFSAGGMDFVIIHLEYDPPQQVLDWANIIMSTYSSRRAIVVTHYALRASGLWNSIIGINIYNSIKDNPNLFMILCGHDIGGEARRDDVVNGRTIHTLLADYQNWNSRQSGYLRIMTFSPKNNKIYVQTYSPYMDSYSTTGSSFFELDYNMTNYQQLGTSSGVPSGGTASFDWYGLSSYTKYFWYAHVTDINSQTGKSMVNMFTTGSIGPGVEGDLTGEGDVNLLDLQIVTMDFGKTSGYDLRADTVLNGEIDIFDVVYVASRFT